MRVRGVGGLQPCDDKAAARLVCPPYDVVDVRRARELVSDGGHGFLRVVRADAFTRDDMKEAAAIALSELEAQGELVETEQRLHAYELADKDGRTQLGVAGVVHIEDYASGVIKAHEHTRRAKEDERAALAGTVRAHTGPVLLGHTRNDGVAELLQTAVTSRAPTYVARVSGAVHRLWRLEEEESLALCDAFAKVSCAYIADGHHRAAGAARVGFEARASGGTQMQLESDWFPAVLFPSDEMRSRPYYRLVQCDDVERALTRVESSLVRIELLSVRPTVDAKPGSVYAVWRGASGQPVWAALYFTHAKEAVVDAQLLQDCVLECAFDISDPRGDDRIEFVGGINLAQLEQLGMQKGRVAFAPGAVSMDTVMKVVDSGKVMPPKSTWFDPKLASGFFVHTF